MPIKVLGTDVKGHTKEGYCGPARSCALGLAAEPRTPAPALSALGGASDRGTDGETPSAFVGRAAPPPPPRYHETNQRNTHHPNGTADLMQSPDWNTAGPWTSSDPHNNMGTAPRVLGNMRRRRWVRQSHAQV